MKFLKKIKFPTVHRSLFVILTLGAFLRFYNLGWGLPYPFHPDERNMADGITRLSSQNLDPQFYAYGQFPLYLAYFTGTIFLSLLKRKTVETLSFTQAILALRFWSAFFSTATIYIVYLISKKIFGKNSSKHPISFPEFSYLNILISPLLVAFTPGLIQAAHFGTTESVLTFCFLAITYFSLKILEKSRLTDFLWLGFYLGIALGSKISAAVFIAPSFLAFLFLLKKGRGLREKVKILLLFILSLSLSLTFVTSPYLLLKFRESLGTLLYEISVAQGQSLPFYTRQFIQTVPVIFQLQKIFPYALGWPIFILGILGILVSISSMVKKIIKKSHLLTTNYQFLITLISFLIYFLSQAFLFAKWTRFMTPIFPFFSLFAGYFLKYLFDSLKKSRFHLISPFRRNSPKGIYPNILISLLAIIPGLLFFSIYFRPDIRFTASEWIFNNIPSGSQILFDTANVIDIPILPPKSPLFQKFPSYNLKLISYNFYDLDQVPQLYEHLINYLETSDYIFIPSRRIFMNHLRFPEKYPLVTKYYQLLFSGKLGFKEIKTFFPFPELKIGPPAGGWSLKIDDERSEETYTVFDHPVIRIYKKDIYYTRKQYESLF